MKIGMNIPVMVPGLDRDTILQWARRVDVGPYSSLAAGERITFPNPEIMVTMGAAAAATERVRLALTVVVLPMHSPVLIAKQVATLDVISGGRVTLGLGVGARAEDYRAVGATFDTRRLRRMEGQIALMRRVWAGENVVEGAGRPVGPFPVQPGGPELLAGALAPDSVRRAARWADGICGFSFGPSAEEIGAAFDTARQSWTEAERAKPPRLVTSFWFALGSRAREQLDEYLGRYLAFMGQELASALVPMVTTTSAAALRTATRMVEDLGADELILVPTTSEPEEVDRVADILG
jgi:alkanesulfonate monooxygenase SsuD/methylene tetrahydromethanopterin reductase-like flavin-dependent oxidoreductase (luciferase family)